MNKRGVTVFELLVSVSILSLLLVFGISGFRSFFSRVQCHQAVRTVVSALNTARWLAIRDNVPVRFESNQEHLLLKTNSSGNWETVRDFSLSRGVRFEMNALPVFYPTGFATPLCSMTVKNENHSYRLTISIAGRVKVRKM